MGCVAFTHHTNAIICASKNNSWDETLRYLSLHDNRWVSPGRAGVRLASAYGCGSRSSVQLAPLEGHTRGLVVAQARAPNWLCDAWERRRRWGVQVPAVLQGSSRPGGGRVHVAQDGRVPVGVARQNHAPVGPSHQRVPGATPFTAAAASVSRCPCSFLRARLPRRPVPLFRRGSLKPP